jgi:hypothetical protein
MAATTAASLIGAAVEHVLHPQPGLWVGRLDGVGVGSDHLTHVVSDEPDHDRVRDSGPQPVGDDGVPKEMGCPRSDVRSHEDLEEGGAEVRHTGNADGCS